MIYEALDGGVDLKTSVTAIGSTAMNTVDPLSIPASGKGCIEWEYEACIHLVVRVTVVFQVSLRFFWFWERWLAGFPYSDRFMVLKSYHIICCLIRPTVKAPLGLF